MTITVIIPAYNEENYLADTIAHIRKAEQYLRDAGEPSIELFVVDNASTDATASLARALGTTVIPEPAHNIARVRNAGAARATHGVLVFIDADTLIPEETLWLIASEMRDSGCVGGAVDVDHRPARVLVRWYLQFWRLVGQLGGMAQGATQFCRSDVHRELNGYDETLYMGEDVDFYWRLKKFAQRRGFRTKYIDAIRVVPSSRRFDQWPLWRILLWTNPLVAFLLRRRKEAWTGWNRSAPR
jgi:glycosyltransferase involved in cell wall biosynthesis